jgi:Protein of unknown function (DUF726)
LARVKAHGIVQDIFLFGAPVIIKQKECLRAQSIVAGRFVNGYKSNDWILGYLFRASTTGLGRVAGLRPIENCGDIENLNCTELVGGHLLYRDSMPKLMKEAGFLVVSEEFSEMEDPDPDKQRERQIQLYEEIEEAKKLVAQEEAEALRTGKKVKRRNAKKSGFLGLWGKEIETKPMGLKVDGETNPVPLSTETFEYDPYEEKKKPGAKIQSPAVEKKSTDGRNEGVLFDVDKMREELAANGVSITSLESTLPPLVVSSPPPISGPSPVSSPPPALSSPPPAPAPDLHRRSTTPVSLAPHRPHSPSLPTMYRNNVSSGNINTHWNGTISPNRETSKLSSEVTSNIDTEWDIQPRDVTPNRELNKLVVDTTKMNGVWNPSPKGGISMSFEPESPRMSRPSTLSPPIVQQTRSTSMHSVADKIPLKPSPSLSSMSLEKNVWNDDYDDGSGGNITMSFE